MSVLTMEEYEKVFAGTKKLGKVKRMDVKEFVKHGSIVKEVKLETEEGKVFVGNVTDEHFKPTEVTTLESVLDFFVRGNYGSSQYRGNATGRVLEGLIRYFKPANVADFTLGGGTSKDVAKRMGVPGHFSDLRDGFDLLKNSTDSLYELIHLHPAYFVPEGSPMPKYSGRGNMWGDAPHASDGSHLSDYKKYLEWLNEFNLKAYEHLSKNGRLAVLIGDTRKSGKLYSPALDMNKYGELEHFMIKLQHNTVSERQQYQSQRFIPLKHEYLVIMRRPDFTLIPVTYSRHMVVDVRKAKNITWKTLVLGIVSAKKSISLSDLYEEVEEHPKAKAGSNNHVRAKVRQILQRLQKAGAIKRIDSNNLVYTI